MSVKDIVGGKVGNLFGQVTLGVPGVSGTALSIATPSPLTYVDTGDVFDFSGATKFMVEVWAKPLLTQQYDKVFEKRNGMNYGWVLYFEQDGSVVLEMRRSGGQRVAITPAATYPKAVHVAVGYDGQTLHMYVNGTRYAARDLVDQTPVAASSP